MPYDEKSGHDHDDTEPGFVTGGVDTHLEVHVAAAVDHLGGVLGTETFPTTGNGYQRLLRWLRSFGGVTAEPAGSASAWQDRRC